jgi:competence protein ComEA
MSSYHGGLFTLLLILFVAWLANGLSSLQGDRGSVVAGSEICVFITGAVEHSGVYVFKGKPSLAEVVGPAGGLSEKLSHRLMATHDRIANGTRVHLSAEDGSIELTPDSIPAFYRITLGIPLSLNTASEVELEAVPYIGPCLAKAIIQHRSRHGPFVAVEQIKTLPGVGNVRYSRIKPYVGI